MCKRKGSTYNKMVYIYATEVNYVCIPLINLINTALIWTELRGSIIDYFEAWSKIFGIGNKTYVMQQTCLYHTNIFICIQQQCQCQNINKLSYI